MKGGAASTGGGAAPAVSPSSPASTPTGRPTAENLDAWVTFWGKRGIGVDRLLARFGRRGLTDLEIVDLEEMAAMQKQLKERRATADELFPAPGQPPDAEDRGDEPPLNEMEPGSSG